MQGRDGCERDPESHCLGNESPCLGLSGEDWGPKSVLFPLGLCPGTSPDGAALATLAHGQLGTGRMLSARNDECFYQNVLRKEWDNKEALSLLRYS